jgi:tRNA(adenine34) deaminase
MRTGVVGTHVGAAGVATDPGPAERSGDTDAGGQAAGRRACKTPVVRDVADDLDRMLMRRALDEARAAELHVDVPVGAVVVRDGGVVAARHNERELTGDPTAHAEILALREAAAAIGSWRLDECTLYVTLEPCAMCAGAMVNARLGRLVYGAADPKAGATGSLMNIVADPRLNHRVPVTAGVLADKCGQLLRDFFATRRR